MRVHPALRRLELCGCELSEQHVCLLARSLREHTPVGAICKVEHFPL